MLVSMLANGFDKPPDLGFNCIPDDPGRFQLLLFGAGK